MFMDIFLAIPPFTQLNCPYPSAPVLTGYLRGKGHQVVQADLGAEVIDRIFCSQTLNSLFDETGTRGKLSLFSKSMIANRHRYIADIDGVMSFLRNRNPEMAYFYARKDNLPVSGRFENQVSSRNNGLTDIFSTALHHCSMFISDISTFITENTDPRFGLIRYAEKLSMYVENFSEIESAISENQGIIYTILAGLMDDYFSKKLPQLVAISIPFPGNLYAALLCCRYIRENYPGIKIALGGGYVNTELRHLKDPGIFSYADYICLDDGFGALSSVIEHVAGLTGDDQLIRTFISRNGKVYLSNPGQLHDDDLAFHVPDYTGLPLEKYFSVSSVENPMHRLWSTGFWNKLTLAHGCYWARCAFCDTRIGYICRYQAYKAEEIVNAMEIIMKQTGSHGFHFTDEAAPPALLKQLAIEILKRNLKISWWVNIRFEKHFTADLCRLLAASGCIALTGGLETVSDRLLQLMDKGIDMGTAIHTMFHCSQAGIMVHAYLMYGFPTQTRRETIDALETVRQLFENGILQSAFWHRFALTVHSKVYDNPSGFDIELLQHHLNVFANNEMPYHAHHENTDDMGIGLERAVYNYMHGIGLDFPVYTWFNRPVPQTLIPPSYVRHFLKKKPADIHHDAKVIFTGNFPVFKKKVGKNYQIAFSHFLKNNNFTVSAAEARAIEEILKMTCLSKEGNPCLLTGMADYFENQTSLDFIKWIKSDFGKSFRKAGLLIV